MNRLGGKIILWGIVLGMLVFTAIRTLHFLMQTFPPDQQYVAFLALAAFDIGVLAWFYFATNSAEGAAQRTVAYGMIFVCAGGVIITTIGDMVNVSAANGLTTTPSWWFTASLWGVILVVVLNVVAGIVVHLVDPKHQRHLAQEEARDTIHKATLASIKKRAGEIAPRLADQVTQAWEDDVMREMTGHLPIRVVEADQPPLRALPPASPSAPASQPASLPAVSHRRIAWPWNKPKQEEALPVYTTPPQIPQEQLNQDFQRMVAEERARRAQQGRPARSRGFLSQVAQQLTPDDSAQNAASQSMQAARTNLQARRTARHNRLRAAGNASIPMPEPEAKAPPVQGTSETAQDVAYAQRLANLAQAAEGQGYSLDRLERMMGVPRSGNGTDPAKKNE